MFCQGTLNSQVLVSKKSAPSKEYKEKEGFSFQRVPGTARTHFESHMLTFLVGLALKKVLVYSRIVEWLNVMVIKMFELV